MAQDPNIGVKRELKKLKKVKSLRDKKETEGVLKSLVSEDNRERAPYQRSRETANVMAVLENLRNVNQSIVSNKRDIEYLSQLFPDIELAIQILVSSIISPKDMTQSTLYFTSDLEFLPPDVQSGMLDYYKKYMEENYSLMSNLSNIIRKVLFETGSHVTAILPDKMARTVISQATGVGFESERLDDLLTTNNIGLVNGEVIRISTEKNEEWSLNVTDCVGILPTPDLKQLNAIRKVTDVVGLESGLTVGNEAVDIEVEKLFAKVINKRLLQKLGHPDTVELDSLGKPVVLGIPSESILPAYMPGKPDYHIGYFILVDGSGNPVSGSATITGEETNQYRMVDLTKDRSSAKEVAKKFGIRTKKDKTTKGALDAFKDIVEQELKAKLQATITNAEVNLDGTSEIYQMMFSRALKNQKTRLVYVPADMVSYIAYKFADNGVGKTIIEDIMLLASMRAILLFSKLMAATKNSIAITKVGIKLDEEDPDPSATIEKTISEVMATRQSYLPVGVLNPADLTDWVHRAGIQFEFSNHPGLPDMELDFSYEKPSHEMPDDELDENIRKSIIMAMGLNPEMVDNAFSPEFATTVVSNNILLAKRVRRMQDIFAECFDDYIYKLGIYDEYLKEKLAESIGKNISEVKKLLKSHAGVDEIKGLSNEDIVKKVTEAFISSVSVSFPNTDEADLENLSEAFSKYKDALEETIESVISEEAIPADLAGDISDMMDVIKDSLKHYYLRKWMAENNFMPELLDAVSYSQDGEPKLDIYDMLKRHIEGLGKNTASLRKALKKIKKKLDSEVEKLENEDDEDEQGDQVSDNEPGGNNEETGEDEPEPAPDDEGAGAGDVGGLPGGGEGEDEGI